MSVSVVLIPLAIAVSVTAADTFSDISLKRKCGKLGDGVETRFNSSELLSQTLSEHGLDVRIEDYGNTIYANSANGNLIYKRTRDDDNFKMYFEESIDLDGLLCDCELLENEYDYNVQSFTYDMVMKNIPESSEVEEQILEDDSILLTITI